jgi:Ni/Fe-hydrogenase 1 B-type cytochrome subunit
MMELIRPRAATTPSASRAGPERYERVYVWQWPIRIFHWTLAASITVLFATGLMIASPILTATGEPFEVFVHARVRQVHFIAGFVFAVAYVWRAWWFLMGNRFARTGFPFFWRPSWWRELVQQAYDYLRFDFGTPHIGHNALGGLSYVLFVAGLGLLEIGTGMALFSQSNPGGFLDGVFGWVIPLLGGSARTHMWHHLASWGFAIFAILHVYIVMLDARQYRNGLLISMITGHKFRRDDGPREGADEE